MPSSRGTSALVRLHFHKACEILVAPPGTEPVSPALGGGPSNTGAPGKSPVVCCDKLFSHTRGREL